jgi:CheY-like chemotaxis protein
MLEDEVNPVLPDVILLDLNMPKMNGIEFLKIIRSSERFGNLNVFIMTTSGENTDRKITEELGVSGYVIKPMSYTGNLNRSDSMEAFVLFHLRKILSGSH